MRQKRGNIMARKIRTAIIGCGGIANNKHIPAIFTVPDVEVVALCDIKQSQIDATKARYPQFKDCAEYLDYKDLLKDDSIECIHCCTPNRAHSFITIDSLRAGKNVICEKPMAKTYAEAVEMCKAAKETGKVLTIGYQNRNTSEMLYAHKRIEQGEIGEIYYATAHAVRRRAVPNWGVFLNEYEQGGGPLIDIGTHALDLTLWHMNNYRPVMVVGQTFKKLCREGKDFGNIWGDFKPEEFTVEDSAFGFIKMENGAVINLESSWALNTLDVIEAKCTLCGTEGGIDFRDGVRINKVVAGAQTCEKPDLNAGGVAFYEGNSGGTPESIEANRFYGAVRGEDTVMVKPEEACTVTRILEGIYESAKTGKPVYFTYDD